MPKYFTDTRKARAKLVARSCVKHSFKQSAVAKELGVTHQAISKQVNHNPIVRTELQKALRQVGLSTKYRAKKFKKLLEAKRFQSCDVYVQNDDGKYKINENSNDFIEIDDNITQLGTLRLLCQVENDIKENKNGNGNAKIVNIIYGYPARPFDSTLRKDER